MGLGLPLALLGLLAVGIPLWLHRVRRRSLRDVPLPTIALLSRAIVQKRRTLSFLDRPLLLARILLAVLCALALSRPYLSQIASYATERPIALSIVLDDSMSMHQKATRGASVFEVAQKRAARVLSELAPDSQASVILGGNAPRIFATRTTDLPGLRERVLGLTSAGARGTALPRALELAVSALTTSRLSVREVLVLTDCAAHAQADKLDSDAAHVRVECLAPAKDAQNLFISDLKLTRAQEVNAPDSLSIGLRSTRTDAAREVEVSVHLDGRRVSEHSATLKDGMATLEVTLEPATLREARVLGAHIDTDNAIAEDDSRELLLKGRAELSLLLVDGDPAPNQLDDELRYASVALSVENGERSLPRVTRIDADGLSAATLDTYDVVVLANVRAPSAEVAARLERYVARGGGLLITAGDHVDAFAYRGSMGSLLPAIVRSSAPAEPALAVKPASALDSPLLPEAGRGLETGATNKRLLLEPPAPPAQVLLAFEDGTPLLVTGQHGQGSVALWTTTLDDDWSDLPLTPGFLPLLTGLVRGLSPVDALPPGPHLAGAVLEARVPAGASALYLVTPDGRRVDVALPAKTRAAQPKGARVRLRDTAVPGVYRAFAALDGRREQELDQLSFVVVPDARDSELGTRLPKSDEERRAVTTPAVRARGVENWFWLLFGLLALIEGSLRLVRRPQAQPAT